jgi:hypothetical protein
MARLAKDAVVISQPVRTFPNGDYFYVELSRQDARYHCSVKMACSGKLEKSLIVAKALGKTIREAEENCFQVARHRCPGLPGPPYIGRGVKRRVAVGCPSTNVP